MKKSQILELVVTELKSQLETSETAAKTAHSDATDTESVAENQYDTRGLEASYLAAGQAQRALDLKKSINVLKNLKLVDSNTVVISSLVNVEVDGQSQWFFLLPEGGGIGIQHSGESIKVVTPEAPLGQNLLDRSEGDDFEMPSPNGPLPYDIVNVL